MNDKRAAASIRIETRGAGTPARKSAGRAPASGRARSGRGPGPGAAVSLASEAHRLLAALSRPDARVVAEPGDPARLIVTRMQGAVSLAAGRFRREAAQALVRQDLARWSGTARTSLAITAAGEAFLRRAAARPDGTGFLEQHRTTECVTITTPDGPERVRIDVEEGPLDWLRRRKGRDGAALIGDAEFAAGERLRRDITVAGLLPRVTARWDAPRSAAGAPQSATEAMLAARQRLRHAFAAVGGEFADLLTDLCGFGKGLAQIERERGWPARSGKVAIRLALSRLAEHYGLGTSAAGPAASRGIRVWQGGDG